MKSLFGKKILFIAPKTFGYEKEIIKNLESRGAIVSYYDDRPFCSNIKKVVLRIFPFLLSREVDYYFNDIVEKSKSEAYDYVFCIKLECFPSDILSQLRSTQPYAKFVYYSWDSFSNSNNALSCLKYFDSVYTFDIKDAERYTLTHRPLFYLPEYSSFCVNSKNVVRSVDVFFVGSVHYVRYQIIKDIAKVLSGKITFDFYMYVPNKFIFYARKLLLFPFYGRSKMSEFSFSSLSKAQVFEYYTRGISVLDICHHRQTGLTMRTIEALGAQKKLVTNNKNVINYDFYNENNILVFDHSNLSSFPNELKTFLKKEFEALDANVYYKYSLSGWVDEVLDLG